MLDPEFLAKLQGLRLWPRFAQRSSLFGTRQTSTFKGTSHEFVDYKPYATGDEIKRIDWKVYARRDRFYLRSYEGETNCTLCLLLDGSRSMNFKSPSAALTKWRFACQIVQGLSFVALNSHDACSLALFGDQIIEWRAPKTSWDFFSETDKLLENFSSFSEETDYSSSFKSFIEQAPRRSLVVVVSDFLGANIEEVACALEAVASLRHEVVAIRVLDPFELDLRQGMSQGDSLSFEALEDETPAAIAVSLREIERPYSKRMTCEEEIFRSRMLRKGIDYWRLLTDQNPSDDLIKILRQREHFSTL